MLRFLFPSLVVASVGLLLWSLTGIARPQPAAPPRTRAERILAGSAFLLAVLPALFFLLVPTYSSRGDQLSSASFSVPSPLPTRTAWQVNGPRVLLPLLAPLLLTAAAAIPSQHVLRRHVAGAATVLMALFVGLAMLSIGCFYLPATVALALAAMQRPPRGPT